MIQGLDSEGDLRLGAGGTARAGTAAAVPAAVPSAVSAVPAAAGKAGQHHGRSQHRSKHSFPGFHSQYLHLVFVFRCVCFALQEDLLP